MPLKRTLTLSFITFYGLGTILGAGIYALIGIVAQEAKDFTPFAFLIAGAIAFLTAASYAELTSRFPESAGSALYVKKAFNRVWLSGLTGWAVVVTGLVTSATLTLGFVNYIHYFYPLSSYFVIGALVIGLAAIAIWGITESAITILLMTLLEIIGLLLVIWYGKGNLTKLSLNPSQFLPPFELAAWKGILSGAFIAFYAFIGFEDMVNLAEETKKPTQTIPAAIFLALITATIIYLLVSLVTITSLPHDALIKSDIPLAQIIKASPSLLVIFSVIAMVAISNGILVQIVMSSRLLYGMAKHGSAPKIFSAIYERTQVPLIGTIAVSIAIIILAYWFPIETLAKATSTIMLLIFSMIHLSLLAIKLKKTDESGNYFSVPTILPFLGLIISISFLVSQIASKIV